MRGDGTALRSNFKLRRYPAAAASLDQIPTMGYTEPACATPRAELGDGVRSSLRKPNEPEK